MTKKVRVSNNCNSLCISIVPRYVNSNMHSFQLIDHQLYGQFIRRFQQYTRLTQDSPVARPWVKLLQNSKRLSHFNNVLTVITVISLWNCRDVRACVRAYSIYELPSHQESPFYRTELRTITVQPGCKIEEKWQWDKSLAWFGVNTTAQFEHTVLSKME